MIDLVHELSATPAIYPQKIDLVRDEVFLVGLRETDYRAASFLDDRVLPLAAPGRWEKFSTIVSAAASLENLLPLHFIFHAGHVGSTLLSRILDETGVVLGLREPLPLRTLADANDRLSIPQPILGPAEFQSRLHAIISLWQRGFAQTRIVVVKATSNAARLAPRLLIEVPAARALYLNVSAEVYLATLLANETAVVDLIGHGTERLARLQRYVGGDLPELPAMSPGELAAASWLAERLCQKHIVDQFGPRILSVDFEQFLADVEHVMEKILTHFTISVHRSFLDNARGLSSFRRYSKAPQQLPYSPSLRAEILRHARVEHIFEIGKGLRFLEGLARRDGDAASVL